MKYLIGFLLFWRRFIVGDDSTIAIGVMWTLLFSWSLATNFYDAWAVVPIGVIALLSAIIYTNTKPASERWSPSDRLKLYVAGELPFVIVCVIPLSFFRIFNGQADFDLVVVPIGLFLVTAFLVGQVARFLYTHFPILAIFLLGLCAFIVNLVLQPAYIQAAMNMYEISAFGSILFSLAAVALFATTSWRIVRQ